MIWPDAQGIVAKVHDECAFWNRPFCFLVGQAMSEFPWDCSTGPKQPIADTVCACGPVPAAFGFINLAPEALCEDDTHRLGAFSVKAHTKATMRMRRTGPVPPAFSASLNTAVHSRWLASVCMSQS